jgi:iron(III) transport system ATP-binding protein
VGVLQHGVLSQLAAPKALYGAPATPELADFIGEAVFAPGLAADGHASSLLGRLCLAPGAPEGEVRLMIRPEQIRFSANGSGVPARVENVIFYGHDAVVDLTLAGSAQKITTRIFSQAAPQPGDEVRVCVEGQVVAYPATRGA